MHKIRERERKQKRQIEKKEKNFKTDFFFLGLYINSLVFHKEKKLS